jgi:hypothetical protein
MSRRSREQLEAVEHLIKKARKLSDRELMEEIFDRQIKESVTLSKILSNTHWSFIMIGTTIGVLLTQYPPLWLR